MFLYKKIFRKIIRQRLLQINYLLIYVAGCPFRIPQFRILPITVILSTFYYEHR